MGIIVFTFLVFYTYGIQINNKFCQQFVLLYLFSELFISYLFIYFYIFYRRNDNKWRLSSPIQDRCIFIQSSNTSGDFTVPLPEIQSCLGQHIWSEQCFPLLSFYWPYLKTFILFTSGTILTPELSMFMAHVYIFAYEVQEFVSVTENFVNRLLKIT